ncbi:MAG: hypothetical protein KAS32_29420 [Candidatus Peribacteraceae bacterium]|nr:hypothetical protein [Candidatus Peribacteraceae bacterium]
MQEDQNNRERLDATVELLTNLNDTLKCGKCGKEVKTEDVAIRQNYEMNELEITYMLCCLTFADKKMIERP